MDIDPNHLQQPNQRLAQMLQELTEIAQRLDENHPLYSRLQNFHQQFSEFTTSDYHFITRNISDIVGHLDVNGIVQYINPATETVLGIDAQEVIGQPVLNYVDHIHPDDVEKIMGKFKTRNEHYMGKVELRFRHTNGEYIWIEVIANLLKDQQDNPTGIVFTIRNVSDRKEIEDNLQRQKTYLDKIINSNPNVIEVKDSYGRFTLLNQAAASMYGRSITDLIGKTNADIAPNPSDAQAFREADREVIKLLQPKFISEEPITYSDGSLHWHQTIKLPLIHDDGEPHVLVISTDITNNKIVDDALKDSEIRYRELFEGIDDAITVHDMDGNYLDVNDAACRRYGYTYEEFLTLKITDLDEPSLASGFKERLAQQVEHGGLSNIIGTHITKDGRHIPVDINTKHITHRGKPAVLALIRDISPLKQIETELREAERKMHDILASIPDMIMRVNRDGDILEVKSSPDFEPLYPAENYAENIRKSLPPDRAEEIIGYIQQTLNTGKMTVYEHQIPNKYDELSVYEGRIVAYSDNEVLNLIRDVTDRKKREQFVIEQEQVRLLKSFIDNTYHDLQTPITTFKTSLYLLGRMQEQIIGNGETLQQNATIQASADLVQTASNVIDLAVRANQRVNTINDNVNRLQHLISSMISLTRLQSNTNYKFAPANVNHLLDICHEQVYDKAQDKSIEIVLKPAPHKLMISADMPELQLALYNVVENAINFSPPESLITIETSQKDDKAVITVTDQGIGINEDDLPQIFERFYRVDQARGMDTGGAGIGLTISQTIIEAHKGTIEVESTPEKGSQFRIVLPLLDAE